MIQILGIDLVIFSFLCRPRPQIIENIPQLRIKEKSIYKPSDLWTPEDDAIFLKYCGSKRASCYHTIIRDTGCRPHEILRLKLKDIAFKSEGDRQYAEVVVNEKTGTRPLPLIDSLPYLNDYLLNEHPQQGNPNAALIAGNGKSLGRPINVISLEGIYSHYKKSVFPKLLDDPSVVPEDKQKIKELLQKPFSPYLVGRHTSLTQKSKYLGKALLGCLPVGVPTLACHSAISIILETKDVKACCRLMEYFQNHICLIL